MLADLNDFDPSKDMPRQRTIELEGNKIHLRVTDPYGFWTVHLDKGQVPVWLRGSYTSFVEAEKDARRWIAEKDKTVKV